VRFQILVVVTRNMQHGVDIYRQFWRACWLDCNSGKLGFFCFEDGGRRILETGKFLPRQISLHSKRQ